MTVTCIWAYKKLTVLKHEDMKGTVTNEYKSRVRNILDLRLNEGNLVKAINTWDVTLLTYSVAFLEWRKLELKE